MKIRKMPFYEFNQLQVLKRTYENDVGDYNLSKQVRALLFIGRYGGDEFIILLPSTKEKVIPRIIESILEALKKENYFKSLIEEWIGEIVQISADEDMYIEKEKSKKRS